MGQIIYGKQKPRYCNLAAIQTGGSKADTVLANGEIWLVDTTNATKVNDGTGVYDAYIKGDGNTAAKNLTVEYLTARVDLSAYSTTAQMNAAIQSAVSGKQDTISDLATIRSGAALGATAIQSHQDISGKANAADVYTKSQVDTALNGKQDEISSVTVAVDANTGTPAGTVSFNNNTLAFSFQNLKGATGAQGPQGIQGVQGPQGPKGDTGVTGDASSLTIIHGIDKTSSYGTTDVCGADAAQALLNEIEGGFYY